MVHTDDDAILRNVSDSIHMLLLAGEGARFQKANLHSFLSRMKLLKPCLDYLREVKIPLPRTALACFQYLDDVLQKAKVMVEGCGSKRSKMYMVYRCHQAVSNLQDLAAEICQVLDTVPLSSLPFSSHTRSQMERCNQEMRRLKFSTDAREVQLAEEIGGLLKNLRRAQIDPQRLKELLQQLDLQTRESLLVERDHLEKEKEQADASTEEFVRNQLLALLTVVLGDEPPGEADVCTEKREIPIPPDFCCPLSQKLMSDPVIVASGQTYERIYIQQWLDQGNKTCPKTEQVLAHATLIPNYTVKALIANWCEMNNVPLPDPPKVDAIEILVKTPATKDPPTEEVCAAGGLAQDDEEETRNGSAVASVTADEQRQEAGSSSLEDAYYFARGKKSNEASNGNSSAGRGNHSSDPFGDNLEDKSPRLLYKPRKTRSRRQSEKLFDIIGTDEDKERRIQSLVEELGSSCVNAQRAAVAELRLLAKNNTEDRIRIANAGAIRALVTLLSSPDSEVQENSVTALLNLSLNEGNKHDIVDAGAVEPLIGILNIGNAEARQNAAATIFSLSVKQEYTAMIGAAGAIPPLVELLKSGSPRGKKDAATALFNLSIYHDNKPKVVQAGAVRPLIDLICEPRLGMVDKAVAVVANLATTAEGRAAIGDEGGIPALVEVVEAGSQRGKENAAAALLTLCSNSVRYRAMVYNEGVTPMLHVLAQTGTARGKEKASALLRTFREQRNGNLASRSPQDRPVRPPLM